MTTIAIVIVNYNTCDYLRRCLASIHEGDAAEVIVVDNASSDGSVEMVRVCFPHVTLWANKLNVGYGAAANEAFANCSTDYVLLLNSDTLLENDTAQRLKSYLDQHPQTALVGPRLSNADGTLQASCYPNPTPFYLFLEESLLGRLIAYLPGLSNRYLRTWRHDKVRAVPWVLGAAIAIRRDAFLSVGGFDPAFFMYFEEIDLCHRLRAAGWLIDFAPVTTILHAGGASTSQQYAKMQYRLFSSTQLFYRRHYTCWQLRFFRLLMIPPFMARLTLDALRYGHHYGQPYDRTRSPRDREDRTKSLATLKVRYRMLRESVFALAKCD
jgi:N-acetylglucosaminyl-diphospho-decaprenol L-rhamnosyltransferase